LNRLFASGGGTVCRLKHWRRIATYSDKRAITFATAVAVAAIVIWWT